MDLNETSITIIMALNLIVVFGIIIVVIFVLFLLWRIFRK